MKFIRFSTYSSPNDRIRTAATSFPFLTLVSLEKRTLLKSSANLEIESSTYTHNVVAPICLWAVAGTETNRSIRLARATLCPSPGHSTRNSLVRTSQKQQIVQSFASLF
jgi:hypothetical protein